MFFLEFNTKLNAIEPKNIEMLTYSDTCSIFFSENNENFSKFILNFKEIDWVKTSI